MSEPSNREIPDTRYQIPHSRNQKPDIRGEDGKQKPAPSYSNASKEIVDLWNATYNQKLNEKTYRDIIRKRMKRDPEFLEKSRKAIPLSKKIDDSDWPGSSRKNLNWFLRNGRGGSELPTIDKILDGGYRTTPKDESRLEAEYDDEFARKIYGCE